MTRRTARELRRHCRLVMSKAENCSYLSNRRETSPQYDRTASQTRSASGQLPGSLQTVHFYTRFIPSLSAQLDPRETFQVSVIQ